MNKDNSEKPRILFLVPQPFFSVRGSPFRVRATVTALSELGYCVDLVVLPFGNSIALPNVRIYRLLRLPFLNRIRTGPSCAKLVFDVMMLFYALWRITRTKYHSIHGVEEGGIVAAALGSFFGIPYVFDMHSRMSEQLGNLPMRGAKLCGMCMGMIERFCIRRAAAVMTVGDEHTRYAIQVAPAVPAVSVQDIALDTAYEPASADAESLRRELGMIGKQVIVYTGNLDPCQGIGLLLRGFAAALEAAKDAGARMRLIIVGGGEEEQERRCELEALSEELGIRQAVCFTGCRPAEEMGGFMTLADVLVSPRVSGANTPLKIYSYMASGRPIVATNISSHTQVLNERCALLCRPEPDLLAHCLLQALEPGPEAERCAAERAAAAKQILQEKFSKQSFCRRLEQVYAGVRGAVQSYEKAAARPMTARVKRLFGVVIEEGEESVRKPLWKAGLRLFLSAAVLFIVYRSVDPAKLFETFQRVRWSTALVIIALYAIGQVMSSIKWSMLLKEIGVERRLTECVRAYFFGMFVNTVGLGTVGGDLARALVINAPAGLRTATVATVIADRVHGLIVLFAFGAVALHFVSPPLFGAPLQAGALPLLALLAAGWLVGPRLLTVIVPAGRWARAAQRVQTAFPKSLRCLSRITLVSMLFHALQLYAHLIILTELGENISILVLCATVPFINIASSLPISINGLGIREAMYVMVLSRRLGVPHETAVAMGALWFAVVTLVSIGGGVVCAMLPVREPALAKAPAA